MTSTFTTPTGFPRLAPRIRRSPALMFTVAAVAFVGAVLNGVGIAGFPADQTFERIVAIGITVDLIAIAILLTVIGTFAVIGDRGETEPVEIDPTTVVIRQDGTSVVPESIPRITIAALLGTVFGVVSWALWLALSGSSIIWALATGNPVSYLNAAAAGFYFGLLWVLGTVLGAAGRHRGGTARNLKLSASATALGVALMIPLVTLSLLHGAGIVV